MKALDECGAQRIASWTEQVRFRNVKYPEGLPLDIKTKAVLVVGEATRRPVRYYRLRYYSETVVHWWGG